MKKIVFLLTITLLFIAIGSCDDGESKATTGTVTMNVTYSGDYGNDVDNDAIDPSPGTKLLYLNLYKNLDTTVSKLSATPTKTLVSSGDGTDISISGVEPGTYHVAAYYDYRAGGSGDIFLNKYDRYAFYNSSGSTPVLTEAESITVTAGGTISGNITIERHWEMQDSKTLLTATDLTNTTSLKITVTSNITTFHTDSTDPTKDGDGKVYVLLYRQLDSTSPRYNILYEGSTALSIANTAEQTVTINNIITGVSDKNSSTENFHIVFFYNYKGGGELIGNPDYYTVYMANGTYSMGPNDPTNAPAITDIVEIVKTENKILTGPFDASAGNYIIQSQGKWCTTP